jgi:hypothetical protein
MLPRLQQAIGRRGVAGAILVVALLAAAFYLGTTRPALAMHTAVPSSAEGAISIEADGRRLNLATGCLGRLPIAPARGIRAG